MLEADDLCLRLILLGRLFRFGQLFRFRLGRFFRLLRLFAPAAEFVHDILERIFLLRSRSIFDMQLFVRLILRLPAHVLLLSV